MNAPTKAKRLVGFAAMTPERRAAAGREGGRKAGRLGLGHKFTSETARAAARKRYAPK